MNTQTVSKKVSAFNIAQAYQGFVDEPVPSIIFDAVAAGGSKRAFTLGLLVVAFLAGIGTALLLGKINASTADTVLNTLPAEQLAISAHKTIAIDQVYPVQVNADDIDHLNSWLSYRLGTSVSVSQLGQLGYTLIGASLIPDGDIISSMVVYENKQQERVSLLTRYASGQHERSDTEKSTYQSINVIHWENQGYQYALTSSLSTSKLKSIQKFITN